MAHTVQEIMILPMDCLVAKAICVYKIRENGKDEFRVVDNSETDKDAATWDNPTDAFMDAFTKAGWSYLFTMEPK